MRCRIFRAFCVRLFLVERCISSLGLGLGQIRLLSRLVQGLSLIHNKPHTVSCLPKSVGVSGIATVIGLVGQYCALTHFVSFPGYCLPACALASVTDWNVTFAMKLQVLLKQRRRVKNHLRKVTSVTGHRSIPCPYSIGRFRRCTLI